MADKLEHILQRIDSRHLSKLWTFYRDYFKCDESCLDFIFCAVYRIKKVDTNKKLLLRLLHPVGGALSSQLFILETGAQPRAKQRLFKRGYSREIKIIKFFQDRRKISCYTE